MLIKGHEQNERDGVFRQIQDPKLRELVVADFNPIPDSKLGELAVNFDVIVGLTPADDQDRKKLGGVAKSEWNRERNPPRRNQ
jgi:protocatechuate 3,4-dioxygenase beta subunit